MCGCHGFKATAGWRFGNLIDGTQAEYVLVPDAQANLAPIPDGLTDEQVLMCPDIMSTGFKGPKTPTSASVTRWWCLPKAPLACAPRPVRACWAPPPSLRWTATTTAWALRRRWAPMSR